MQTTIMLLLFVFLLIYSLITFVKTLSSFVRKFDTIDNIKYLKKWHNMCTLFFNLTSVQYSIYGDPKPDTDFFETVQRYK